MREKKFYAPFKAGNSKLQLSPIRFVWQLSIATAYTFASLVLLWQLLRAYPGDVWLPVRMGSYFAHFLFIAIFPVLVVALLSRHKPLMGLSLLLISLFIIQFWPALIPRPYQVSAKDEGQQLRVMTFNVHYGNRNVSEIVGLIETEKPDIIAMQEVSEDLELLLLPELKKEYPYYVIDDTWSYLFVLLSRYPIKTQLKPMYTHSSQLAIASTPAGQVTIWNIHTPRPIVTKRWYDQKKMLEAVAEEIDKNNGPFILLGDFNTTDQTENYRIIASRLTDVQHVAGRGFGFTYPEPTGPEPAGLLPEFWYINPFKKISPFLGIDHIFISDQFSAQEIHTIPGWFGSDHRPVIATLYWNK